MTPVTNRLRIRAIAQKRLNELFENPSNVYVIHYSCEGFFDRPRGFTPRIASIAVMKLDDRQTTSFSVAQIAERKHLSGEEIEGQYYLLELEMLEAFFSFIAPFNHNGCFWLHWNMRNNHYGFEALEHRYSIFDGQPVTILQTQRRDLSQILRDIYGKDYIEKPQLYNLIVKNDLLHDDLLPGEEEAIAFDEKEFFRMHESTLSKVSAIGAIAWLCFEGKLKTNAHPVEIYGSWIVAIIEIVTNHWLFKFLGFIALLITFISFVIQLSGN
jgi:hypothetical protein